MSLLAVESLASGSVTSGAYDSTKWNLGDLIKQRTDLGTPFIGPCVTTVARPVEQSAAIPGIYPWAMRWSSNIDWVFLCDNATAAATRRLQMYEFNRNDSTFTWKGFITLTFPTTTAHTIKSLRMTYKTYSTGTVGVSGAAVTGSGTAWLTSKMVKAQTTVAGSRIGFGSTDPTQITTWYYINALSSDTALTICTNVAGTLTAANISIAGGTSYVIEDLKAVVLTTNATAANGGLFIAKGLSRDHFTAGGVTILGTATSGYADDTTNVYWMGDASTNTNTAGVGIALEPETSWTSQNCYVIDSTGGVKIYKYNIRGALSITIGAAAPYKDISQRLLTTGSQAITGTLSATNNGRYAITNHGPLSGEVGVYIVTTTRIYGIRASGITSGSTSFLTYTMTEVPPGGTATHSATGAMSSIEYTSTLDRFVVCSTGTAGARSYITRFNTTATAMDHIFLIDGKQINQSIADSMATVYPSITALVMSPWLEGGMLYLASIGTTAATNFLYAMPIGADWNYVSTTSQRAITPAISTPNCDKFKRVYVARDRVIGSDGLGKPADPFKILYRTSGISDNSGTWLPVPEPNDLSGLSSSSSIQFAFEFKTISDYCIGSRIFLVGVVYDDLSTSQYFQPSATLSNSTTKAFAWRFSTAVGGTVPALKIRLYNASLGTLLLEDTTAASAYGAWSKSTDGGDNWGSYNSSDKANETTYIRYIPSSLGDNISVRALLTIA